MSDFERAAHIQAKCACAIIEALAIAVERLGNPGSLDRRGAEQVRSLVFRFGIHPAGIRDDFAGKEPHMSNLQPPEEAQP